MTSRRDMSRISELRSDRALGDITPDGLAELRAAEAAPGTSTGHGPDDYELAAAAILLAFRRPSTPMPMDVRRAVERGLADSVEPDGGIDLR